MLKVTGRLRDGFSFYRWESWGSERGLAYQRWGLLFCKHLLLIEGQLLYNIVLVSAIHQHESAVGTHMCSLPLEPPSQLIHLGHHQFELPVSYIKFPLAI